MSDERPAPLVPAFLDLREFSFMPLQVQKLRDSTFATRSTGDEFMAGVLLWSASWHQVPAGSLANDDAEFAKLAGFGRVIREWKKVKNGALHGFIECSDGRLYHPVTCEQAIESWNGKIDHAWRKECDRVRKTNKDRAKNGEDPLEMPTKPYPVPMFSLGKTNGAKRNSSGNAKPSDGIPAEKALKGQGQLSKKEEEALAQAPAISPKPASPIAKAEAVAEAVFDPVEQGRAIGRAFGDAMNAVYGSMAMRSQNATDEFHCAKQLAAELGLTGAEAAAIFEAEMRSGAERGREPIRSIRYFDKRIREAYAKDAAAKSEGEAHGLPAAAPAVQRPYEDHATSLWRSRLEGFRDFGGAWSQSYGPKPPGLGKPRPKHADYPEALAVEMGVSSPAADEAGEAA